MGDVRGKLERVRISTDVVPEPWPKRWLIEAQVDRDSYSATTTSRIVLAVLETALLKRAKWDVELGLSDVVPPAEPVISRVRIQDDRIDFCKGTFNDDPKNTRLRPFTPTAFADENPKKWGFFFYNPNDKNCREYKGLDLGVYATIEQAWYEARTVVLTLDGGLIVAAELT